MKRGNEKIKGKSHTMSNKAICFYLASLLYLLELGLLPFEQQTIFLKLKKKNQPEVGGGGRLNKHVYSNLAVSI